MKDLTLTCEQVAVALDENAFVAPLEHVPDTAMAPVDELGIDAIELAHAGREIAFRGLDDEVVVIAHLAPGVNRPVEPLTALRQHP